MKYSIGSIADLISGTNTPNKPKVIKKDIQPVVQSKKSHFGLKYEKNSSNINKNSKFSSKRVKSKGNKLASGFEKSKIGPVSLEPTSEESIFPEYKQIVEQLKTERNEEQESKTIFVGNVPLDANKVKLKKLFAKFGTVDTLRMRCAAPDDPNVSKKLAIIKKRFHPDRKTLHCFIRFQNREEACRALEMNGYNYKNHHLRVNMSQNEDKPDENKAIFIGNVPFDAEEEDLWKLFESVGKLSSVRLVRDARTSMGKGFGYVNFQSSDSVELALEKNDFQLKNRLLRISRCSSSAGKKSQNKKEKKRQRNFKKNKDDKGEKKTKPITANSTDYQGTIAKTKKKKKLDKGSIKKKRIIKLLTTNKKQ